MWFSGIGITSSQKLPVLTGNQYRYQNRYATLALRAQQRHGDKAKHPVGATASWLCGATAIRRNNVLVI